MFNNVSPKVDFPNLERQILDFWEKNKILHKYLVKNQNGREKFSFLDGPITANNPMGVHHAWGRTYKDLWQRFFNMLGFKQRFQNGFDEQGLWVEVEVEKELGLATKKDIENLVPGNIFESIAKFVNLCKSRVRKYSEIMTKQSKRLGYFMDWDNSYHTSSEQNNYAIWHYLKTIHAKGWLYKGRDSVPWCPRCGTAISQHEILTEEYKELEHDSIFFKLPIVGRKNEFLFVWTTTPWTIPGNVSVAVNPNFDYLRLEVNDEILWFVKDRLSQIRHLLAKTDKASDLDERLSGATKKGSELVGWEYVGPFDDLERVKKARSEGNFHKVIAAEDLVSSEEGTGFVHIAPGAGEEDFKLSKEQNLPVIELIDEDATYLEGLGFLSGKNAKDRPKIIIDYLENKDNGRFLFKVEKYKHRYPVCWRCKTELVWRVVDEWYINMDGTDPQTKKTYREMLKEAIKPRDRWIPEWGYDRELDWLNNMHDWLISKKRYWGLALPIWECLKCGHFDVIGSKEELEQRAVEGWDKFEGNTPHRPWVDQVKIKCLRCGETIERIKDVGNPWLDAGIVPFSTLKYFEDRKYWQEWFPADFVTESFPGQFKNWFYSLLAMSVALVNQAPFKKLLGYGSVRDEKGEEMHKSKGNAIEFNEAAEKIGVDVMRWLYLRTNPEQNVNFGYHIADEIRRFFHLRFWNVYSFFVTYANLDHWQPSAKEFKPTNVLDRWILSRMNGCIKVIEEKLRAFNAHEPVLLSEDFIVNDLSNWYVRRIRDRVSPAASNWEDKVNAYQTLWVVLVTFSKALAPMIPFITEHMYRNLTGEESVHLADWPESDEKFIDRDLEDEMNYAREVVEKGHRERKAKNIKVRQPLNQIIYGGKKLRAEVEKLISEELNVKSVNHDPKLKGEIYLDTKITNELKKEGEARDLIRTIQEKRKEARVPFNSLVTVYAPSWPKEFEEVIKRETLAKELLVGKEVKIKA